MVTNNAINTITNQFLRPSNNLSDVNNVSTSRNNLGLGVADTPTFRALDIRNASNNFVDLVAPTSGLTNQAYTLPIKFPPISGYGFTSTMGGQGFWGNGTACQYFATATASNSSQIVFSNLVDAINIYYLSFWVNPNGTANNTVYLDFSSTNGATWDTGANKYQSIFVYDATATATRGASAATRIDIGTSGATLTGQYLYYNVLLWGFGTSNRVYFRVFDVMDSGIQSANIKMGGFVALGVGLNAMRVIYGTGNIPSGQFNLYGYI